eukprot:SAG22_NODE_12440_length_442_cov_3.443149_1_plen_51_part_10
MLAGGRSFLAFFGSQLENTVSRACAFFVRAFLAMMWMLSAVVSASASAGVI